MLILTKHKTNKQTNKRKPNYLLWTTKQHGSITSCLLVKESAQLRKGFESPSHRSFGRTELKAAQRAFLEFA